MTDSGKAMILIVLGLVLYFAPAIAGRRKRNSGTILALNLLLGWTVIGWIIALVRLSESF